MTTVHFSSTASPLSAAATFWPLCMRVTRLSSNAAFSPASDLSPSRCQSGTTYLDTERHRQEVLRLRQQLDQLQARYDDRQRRLEQAVVVDLHRQAEFAATAQAEGVSLPVACSLLLVCLGERTPSPSGPTGSLDEGRGSAERRLLAALDEQTRPRVRQVVPDEIFVRRQPILMACVEPQSLCWVSGRRVPAAATQTPTWAAEFAQLPALEQVTKDGGSGLAKGLEDVQPPTAAGSTRAAVVAQDDHFHVLREGAEARCVSAASQAQRAVERAWRRRTGGSSKAVVAADTQASGPAMPRWWPGVGGRRRRPTRCWCRQEQAWQRVASAFTLFDASGQLQTRTQAEATVARRRCRN